MNPLNGIPFRSREDAQRAVVDLFVPLVPAYQAGGARGSRPTDVRDGAHRSRPGPGSRARLRTAQLRRTTAFARLTGADQPPSAGAQQLAVLPGDSKPGIRAAVADSGVDGDVVWSRWQPFPDVEVTTVLCGEAPRHASGHRRPRASPAMAAPRVARSFKTFALPLRLGRPKVRLRQQLRRRCRPRRLPVLCDEETTSRPGQGYPIGRIDSRPAKKRRPRWQIKDSFRGRRCS